MPDPELPDALRDELRGAWHRYLDLLAPLRPGLHGYCRRLTGNLWDAEDLVQETLLRAFGTLGHIHHPIRSPRAYLLRTATNLWIDTLRRRGTEAVALSQTGEGAVDATPGGVRDAGATLLQRLAPQERAAVVLKDVFDMTLEESADVLGTTLGAIKAALHRGRARLREPEGEAASQRPAPPSSIVDRFVELYNATDLPGLLKLMLDTGTVSNVGCGIEYGPESFHSEESWFHRAMYGHPEWPKVFQYEDRRMERAIFRGEPIVLGWTTRRGVEALEQVLRLEAEDGRVSRIRGYAFCPETMREVGEELGVEVRTGLYRYPTLAPGVNYTEAEEKD